MEIRDITQILTALAADRPIFHSEADFQHSLGWEIHKRFPSARMRLEMPFRSASGSMYLDIFFVFDGMPHGIELKYKTRLLNAISNGENYHLKDQSAQDLGRYDFLLDVKRIEDLVGQGLIDRGASLFLTNDSAYWKSPRHPDTIDADFRLHDGRVVQGTLGWGSKASKGTTNGREAAISIRQTYRLSWRDYSEFGGDSYCQLRYLLVTVRK